MIIEFFIPYLVKAKQSMKVTVDKSGRPRTYTAAKVRRNAETLADMCAQHRPPAPLDGPIEARFVFQSQYLAGDRKRDREANRTIPDHTKPDLGNLEKQLEDVLEKVGIIANDSRIYKRTSSKVRTAQPGVQVYLANGEDIE